MADIRDRITSVAIGLKMQFLKGAVMEFTGLGVDSTY